MEKYIYLSNRKLKHGQNIDYKGDHYTMQTATGLIAAIVAEQAKHPVVINQINYKDTSNRPSWMVKYKGNHCIAKYVGNITVNNQPPKHIFKLEY